MIVVIIISIFIIPKLNFKNEKELGTVKPSSFVIYNKERRRVLAPIFLHIQLHKIKVMLDYIKFTDIVKIGWNGIFNSKNYLGKKRKF